METIRVATYNIHKGVQGFGPGRRLEIHNLGHAVEQLDADVVCLQEVRHSHRPYERRFERWPDVGQAEYLAPPGYHAIYKTNAVTRHGEHGNAVLSRWPVVAHRHEDMSDHRFEQRGLLHVELHVHERLVHVIVLHLGLTPASRVRQIHQLCAFIERDVPQHEPLIVAGDFNDWGAHLRRPLNAIGLEDFSAARLRSFPARLPLAQLDYVYARGLKPLSAQVPHGRIWWRMSDHLPVIAEFGLLP